MDPDPPAETAQKRKADAISQDPAIPNPGTDKICVVQLFDPKNVVPARPLLDVWGKHRARNMSNRILEDRLEKMIQRRAAAAALEYSFTEMRESVWILCKTIIEAIKQAMVDVPVFQKDDPTYMVIFKMMPGPKTRQTVRSVFPGVGNPNGLGRDKGWDRNKYSVREFQDMMCALLIVQRTCYFLEVTDTIKVVCDFERGVLAFGGKYRELRDIPDGKFSKTRARR